jgi:predicted amidohydrolase
MRLHLIQLRMDPSESVDARIQRVAGLLAAQGDADLVVLPELWLQGAFDMDRFDATAQSLDGTAISMVREQAQALGTWIHGGSIITREDGHLFNASFIVSPDGALASVYRKLHLFGFDSGEASVLTAGTDLVTLAVGEATLGVTTCYDLRFPEQYRTLIDRGADLFVVPAGWPERRIDHWNVLARARAIENQAFVAALNAVGPSGEVILGGRSLVVDPWGAVIAEAGTGEEVLIADIDLGSVARTRTQFPVLRDRKPL